MKASRLLCFVYIFTSSILFLQCTDKIPVDLLITNVNLLDGTGAALQENMTIVLIGAKMLHAEEEIGSIEVGKIADMILLD